MSLVGVALVSQNVIRGEMTLVTSAKATKRGDREPSPALPKTQHSRAKHGIRVCPAPCTQLKLVSDVRRGAEAQANAAYGSPPSTAN
jgi:hypothetical protein